MRRHIPEPLVSFRRYDMAKTLSFEDSTVVWYQHVVQSLLLHLCVCVFYHFLGG